MAEPFRLREDGIDLFVRLTPKASADALEGTGTTADGSRHIKARVRAVPEKGAANAALEKLLAKALRVPVSSVTVASGSTSRLKTVRITGDPALLAQAAGRLATPG